VMLGFPSVLEDRRTSLEELDFFYIPDTVN